MFPAGNPLAAQLRSVAMMIAARQALGVKRQIFFVSVGGSFDNHSDQFDASGSVLQPPAGAPLILYGKHADLLGQVDAGLKAFYDATVELGVQNNVTTFTESDFGRTLTSNGKGSDHGWGSHHLVMGGATLGGKIYGTFHNMQVGAGNPVDAGQGRLIPTYSASISTRRRWPSGWARRRETSIPCSRTSPISAPRRTWGSWPETEAHRCCGKRHRLGADKKKGCIAATL